jgi:hypothetical protein
MDEGEWTDTDSDVEDMQDDEETETDQQQKWTISFKILSNFLSCEIITSFHFIQISQIFIFSIQNHFLFRPELQYFDLKTRRSFYRTIALPK